jgi:hypothetical protein
VKTKVILDVRGVDLSDIETLIKLETHLSDLVWASVDGRTSATVYVPAGEDPVCVTIEAARRIESVLPDSWVKCVDEDLTSTTEIAMRIGVSREAVRKWVTAATRTPVQFPVARASIGGEGARSTKLWAWAEIAAWLWETRRLMPDYKYLTDAQVAEVNSYLARVAHPLDDAWKMAVGSRAAGHEQFATATRVRWASSANVTVGVAVSHEQVRSARSAPLVWSRR